VLALDLPGGPALLRIVRVHVHRRGETPSLEELQFSGIELPTLGTLATLEAKIKDSIAMMSPDARLFALPDLKNAGWKEAGFRKVATILKESETQNPHSRASVSDGLTLSYATGSVHPHRKNRRRLRRA
jgi:hypothetical protein